MVLDTEDAADNDMLEQLRANPAIEFIDHRIPLLAELRGLLPSPGPELLDERCRWVYYPWRRAVVAVLGPGGYRAVRLDRNRNVVTADEQARLGALRVGVVGLSAGHVIAYGLAAQGLCGELRLADFDQLELTNLNRVPATVFDIGVNKAAATARRIAELDPYLPVRIQDEGVTLETIDEFFDGLSVVVDECDSMDMKAVLREHARARGIPVLMATSDRGLVDVERFDLDPQRPILHGLLGDVDPASLARMSSGEKVPHLLRFLQAQHLSPRGAASLLEIDRTLSTWPQVSGDVAAGAPVIAESVRRIGLGEHLPSGRIRVDISAALDRLDEPELPRDEVPPPEYNDPAWPGVTGTIAAAAIRAPSGGNVQPWRIDVASDVVTIRLAPECSTTMDVGCRGSAVAVGAALFNARVAAAAHRALGPASFTEDVDGVPLQATLQLGDGYDPDLAGLYDAMLARESNRRSGNALPVAGDILEELRAAAEREGARLHVISTVEDLAEAAAIFAAADRARYLTPVLHAEMIAELRWPGNPMPDTGIDIRSLEFGPAELAVVDILRRPDVMAQLERWNAGSVLGEGTRRQVAASSALAVISVAGGSLTDYARGGSAAEAIWIMAQHRGLAVQPMSPIFLYARDAEDLAGVSRAFAGELGARQREFAQLAGIGPQDGVALVLRFAVSAPGSVRSLRNFDRVNLR